MDPSERGEGSGSRDDEAKRMLEAFIYDYLRKNMPEAADVFAACANINNFPPAGAGNVLADWWRTFWNMNSSWIGQNSGAMAGSSSSLVQPGNVMGNPQQSIHGKAPVVIDQSVPHGADMGRMMMMMLMMGQQTAAHLLAANTYQGQKPAAGIIDESLAQAEARARTQALVHAQAAGESLAVAQSIAQSRALIQAEAEARAQAAAMQETSVEQTIAEIITEEAEAQARAKAEAEAKAQAQALAKAARSARIEVRRAAQAQPVLQAGGSSANVGSQQFQVSTVAAQIQQQVPPRGNWHGASGSTAANRRQRSKDVSKELERASKR